MLHAKGSDTSARESLAQFYEAYGLIVFGLARFVSSSDEDAADVAELAWESFGRFLPRIDPERGSVLALLRRHVQYAAGDFYRRRERAVEDLPTPGERIVDLETRATMHKQFEDLLRIVLTHGGPPHQRIVFGFNSLLDWQPKEIVSELSGLRRAEPERRLVAGYLKAVDVGTELPSRIFGRLRSDLRRETHSFSKRGMPRLPESVLYRLAADTKLGDYFVGSGRGEHVIEIVNWVERVRRRVPRRDEREQTGKEPRDEI